MESRLEIGGTTDTEEDTATTTGTTTDTDEIENANERIPTRDTFEEPSRGNAQDLGTGTIARGIETTVPATTDTDPVRTGIVSLVHLLQHPLLQPTPSPLLLPLLPLQHPLQHQRLPISLGSNVSRLLERRRSRRSRIE